MATVTKNKRRASRNRNPDRGSQTMASSSADEAGLHSATRWYQTTFAYGLASGLLLWASFPPLNFWPLAWIAPVFWLRVIQREQLRGRRPYRSLYLAGGLHSMALYYFVILPHWAGYFGWVGMGIYIGLYLPVFVALSRVAVHRLRVPLLIAAPVVWVGLEVLRGILITGFSMALLGHTQVSWTTLIQAADLFGAYTISFALMFVTACVAMIFPVVRERFRLWPAIPIVAIIAAMVLYGNHRLNEQHVIRSQTVRVALIQGSIDTQFDLNQTEAYEREKRLWEQYKNLTINARKAKEKPDLDLIIWPESKFRIPDRIYKVDCWNPPIEDVGAWVRDRRHAEDIRQAVFAINGLDANRHTSTNVKMLVGAVTETTHETQRQRFNTALLINEAGEIEGRYFKMHLVPFGEFVPFGDVFPFFYKLTPMQSALSTGSRPRVFEIAGLRFAPSVCFESTIPRVIRAQLNQLKEEGQPADIMVNVTDDGWFKGSSCLDLHLACTVFRAIENRIPTLVAANTGFSAWIDGSGRVKKKGPRRETAILFCDVAAERWPRSLYQRIGDLPAIVCFVLCGVLFLVGVGSRITRRNQQKLTNS